MSLPAAFAAWCARYGQDKTYWIAYSGGLDSHVLLHLCAKLRQQVPLKLQAVYVNHGLSSHAAAWGEHCANTCKQLQVDFSTHTIVVKPETGQSPEAVARQQRYQLFSQLLSPNDVLLTAHHQDDQAETLLLQLMRGAGMKGLAAMPPMKVFHQAWLGRPLLDFTRADLQAYANTHSLHWIEDESNRDLQFSRNFIRHEVLPLLRQRWPSAATILARSAGHCAKAQRLIEHYVEQDVEQARGIQPNTLSVTALLQLENSRQSHVIRHWLRTLHCSMPSLSKMRQIQDTVLPADQDKRPCVQWGSVEVRRFGDDLYALPASIQHDNQQCYAWNLEQPLQIPAVGLLQAQVMQGRGLLRAGLEQMTVRFRQGGEVCQLPGREHHHTLKHLFQTWKIPHWQRDRIPLIYVGDQLASVVGYCIADAFVTKEEEVGYLLQLN